MNEVERIQIIRGRLGVQKKQELQNQLQIIEDTFKNMIKGVGETILDNALSKESADEKLFIAIKKIATLSAEAGVAFPEIFSVPDAKMYTLQYGITVMNS